MPFPYYTVEECAAQVRRLDQLIEEVTEQATQWSVESKSFNNTGRLDALRREREIWQSRWDNLLNATHSRAQGPRIVPVG